MTIDVTGFISVFADKGYQGAGGTIRRQRGVGAKKVISAGCRLAITSTVGKTPPQQASRRD
ncbi:hypothetical protein AB0F17_20825 [Nonomuraea sp. NPDC026600]|uniref:hypothetical protein n=1 Tax=Nonomuraea sp. NPDC026600 TaxID=3155363 RepID=UPI0033FC1A67